MKVGGRNEERPTGEKCSDETWALPEDLGAVDVLDKNGDLCYYYYCAIILHDIK